MTVDRRLHGSLVRSLTVRHLRSRAVLHLLVVVGLALGVATTTGSALAAAVTAVVTAAALVVGWRALAARSLRWGAAPGQSVTVGYAPTGELSILDVTGRLWLPRGSVQRVLPAGPLTALLGHDLVVALPSDLVDAADTAFLEGDGGPGAPTEPPRPRLRQSCRVDEGVRADLVAAWTRRALRTPDVLLWVVLGLVFLAGGVVALVQGSTGAAVFFAVVALVTVMGCVPFLRRGQETVRTRHPVGAVLRGEVDQQGVTVAGTHSTAFTPWDAYVGHRADGRTLQLRRRDGAFDGVQVLPAALFPPAVVRRIAERIGRAEA